MSRGEDIKRQRVERREWPNAKRWKGICAIRQEAEGRSNLVTP